MTLNSSISRVFAIAALALAATNFAGAAKAEEASFVKLMTANFLPRDVAQVEIGVFRFLPGQIAPIHTHVAPAVGYVAKGSIIYQAEGEKPVVLREGDAFYEPAGPRILRFDNASATETALFYDFSLEQTGEPFFVLEEQPRRPIDRSGLPTVDMGGETIDHVDVYETELESGKTVTLENSEPTIFLVVQGVIDVQIDETTSQHLVAGETFAMPSSGSNASLTNASSEVEAKVISCVLR
jgi:quercetin dioxygenase-like cupin family protein